MTIWRYHQASGALTYGGDEIAIGYAGYAEGKNNPDMQHVHSIGPLPCGHYLIGAPVDTATHGPYVLRLAPDAANEMWGRSGFLIHGDSKSRPGCASQGCIIMPRPVREQIWASDDHLLEVLP